MARKKKSHKSTSARGTSAGQGPAHPAPDIGPAADDGAAADDEDDFESLPGRPLGPDEIDPALIKLSRSHGKVGPVACAGIVLVCLFFLWQLRADLRFSRAGAEPREVSSTAALVATDGVALEDYVRAPAVPDRAFALRVSNSPGDPGYRLAPVQGTDGKLWIQLEGSEWAGGMRYEEVYVGRLRRLQDVKFGDDLLARARARAPQIRHVAGDVAREALASGARTVREPGGDTLELSPGTPVLVPEVLSDRAIVDAVETEQHGDQAAWSDALAAAGVIDPATAQPEQLGDGHWRFTASVGADEARTRVRAAGLSSTHIEAIRRDHETTWGALRASDAGLTVDGTTIPWERARWIGVQVERPLPGDALVLLTAESPETYWYILPLYVGLGLLALLFGWGFVRAVRPDRASPAGDAAA